jgi:hypothetical protein
MGFACSRLPFAPRVIAGWHTSVAETCLIVAVSRSDITIVCFQTYQLERGAVR